jgi:RES domain-containing protein
MDTITAFQIDNQDRREDLFKPTCTPARWSSGRHPAVYASCAASTALLEFLVHQELVPSTLCCGRLALRADAVTMLDVLPEGWDDWPYRPDVQQVGDDWLASRQALALRIPSAVAPASFNLLVNPRHPAYPACAPQFVETFRADTRLRR